MTGGAQAVDLDSLPETAVDVAGAELAERHAPQFLFGSIGVAAINTGGFSGSDERVTFPLPMLYFNYNDRVYWSIASVGGWLWRSDDRKFKLGLLAKARGGVQADDTPYAGIQDRDPPSTPASTWRGIRSRRHWAFPGCRMRAA
jgi:hypothetical protein